MSKTRTTFAFLVGLTALLLALLAFGIYEVSDKRAEVGALNAQIGERANDESLVLAVKEFRTNYAEELKLLEGLILTEDKLVPVIEEIESAARTLGLEAQILSVEESEAEGVKKVSIKARGEGSWSGAYAFVKGIENLPHKVTVESVDLTKEETFWRTEVAFYINYFD